MENTQGERNSELFWVKYSLLILFNPSCGFLCLPRWDTQIFLKELSGICHSYSSHSVSSWPSVGVMKQNLFILFSCSWLSLSLGLYFLNCFMFYEGFSTTSFGIFPLNWRGFDSLLTVHWLLWSAIGNFGT